MEPISKAALQRIMNEQLENRRKQKENLKRDVICVFLRQAKLAASLGNPCLEVKYSFCLEQLRIKMPSLPTEILLEAITLEELIVALHPLFPDCTIKSSDTHISIVWS